MNSVDFKSTCDFVPCFVSNCCCCCEFTLLNTSLQASKQTISFSLLLFLQNVRTTNAYSYANILGRLFTKNCMRFVVLEINKSELQKKDINIWLKTGKKGKGELTRFFFFFLFTFKNQLVLICEVVVHSNMCRAIRGVSVYINLTIEIKVVSRWVLSAFNYIGILVDTNT